MEIIDQRIKVRYDGWKNALHQFLNIEKNETLQIAQPEIIGASILKINQDFYLRVLPGRAYLVENAVYS